MRGLPGRGLMLVCAAMTLGVASVSVAGTAEAGSIAFGNIATLPTYGGEPSITSDGNGVLYDTSPSNADIYRSTDKGLTWTQIQSADNNSGDDCLATDTSNALYWCNLASMTRSNAPLQADDWKSTVASTCGLTNCNWVHGAGAVPADACGTSCQPFGVDRQWTAAYIAPGHTTSTAEVVLMYHDFYGPSQIWVNVSTDGGATFGPAMNVIATSGVPGAVEADGYSMCNTVPTGVDIVPPGLPHAGRIFVSWIAADLAQNATGCNISMLQSFHTLWVAYSDDGGSTWTAQQAYDAGVGHDVSTPFASMTLDDRGNPYLAFDTSPPSTTSPATCFTESDEGSPLQGDAACAYHMWVVWSSDGGNTWDGGGGTIPGSAATAYEVDPSNTAQTDLFPTIAAGDPGQVDIGYLRTNENEPTTPNGKFQAGGCAGPGPSNGNPPYYPPTCLWNLYAAQSLNLTQPTNSASWQNLQVTTTPMHVGDICNLGIFCIDPNSNRNLLDFNMETIDPTTGCAHIAYADDNTVNKLRVANQTAGCLTLTQPTSNVPETPLVAMLVPAGVLAAAGVGVVLRRRRRGIST